MYHLCFDQNKYLVDYGPLLWITTVLFKERNAKLKDCSNQEKSQAICHNNEFEPLSVLQVVWTNPIQCNTDQFKTVKVHVENLKVFFRN